MVLAPVAVFALIAPVVAAEGPRVLSSLLGVAVLVYGACLVQLLLIYGGAVGALARRSPRRFFREALPAVVFAFSSASSAGIRGCRDGACPGGRQGTPRLYNQLMNIFYCEVCRKGEKLEVV